MYCWLRLKESHGKWKKLFLGVAGKKKKVEFGAKLLEKFYRFFRWTFFNFYCRFVCFSIFLSVCLFVHFFCVCLFVRQRVQLSVCVSDWFEWNKFLVCPLSNLLICRLSVWMLVCLYVWRLFVRLSVCFSNNRNKIG